MWSPCSGMRKSGFGWERPALSSDQLEVWIHTRQWCICVTHTCSLGKGRQDRKLRLERGINDSCHSQNLFWDLALKISVKHSEIYKERSSNSNTSPLDRQEGACLIFLIYLRTDLLFHTHGSFLCTRARMGIWKPEQVGISWGSVIHNVSFLSPVERTSFSQLQ